MTMSPRQLSSIISSGKYPVYQITSYGHTWDVEISDVRFDQLSIIDNVEFLKNKISMFGSIIGDTIYQFPIPIYTDIYQKYIQLSYDTLNTLSDNLSDFLLTNESKSLWILYKHCPHGKIIQFDSTPNFIQRQWIILNSLMDKEANHKLISDVFEAAKPWLDKELYAKIKQDEEQDNTDRTNILYDDVDFEQSVLAQVPKKSKVIPPEMKKDI